MTLFSPNSLFNIVFDWELSFIICFCLFFIRLSLPRGPRIMLNELICVDLAYFLSNFLIKIFTNFIIQHWIWQCCFIIEFYNFFFNLLYIRLYQSHDQSHKFDSLTQVKSCHFFLKKFMRLSWSHDPDYEFCGLTRVIFHILFF